MINVTNRDLPTPISEYSANGWASGVSLSPDDHIAVVAKSFDGIEIVNVQDPTHPVFVGTYYTGGEAVSTAFSADGKYIYVADGAAGLQIIGVGRLLGFSEHADTIAVDVIDLPPTDIALSAFSVAENAIIGTVVGTLSTTDGDATDHFNYSLVAGMGDDDNALFSIVDSTLKTAAVFDYEAKSSYSIRVLSTDASGLTTEKQFTITIGDVYEEFSYTADNGQATITGYYGTSTDVVIPQSIDGMPVAAIGSSASVTAPLSPPSRSRRE